VDRYVRREKKGGKRKNAARSFKASRLKGRDRRPLFPNLWIVGIAEREKAGETPGIKKKRQGFAPTALRRENTHREYEGKEEGTCFGKADAGFLLPRGARHLFTDMCTKKERRSVREEKKGKKKFSFSYRRREEAHLYFDIEVKKKRKKRLADARLFFRKRGRVSWQRREKKRKARCNNILPIP